jgi:predicted  nucleic acid-binding Zn-ribbon protein
MSESQATELAHWQSRCDEMQVALERVREERDDLQSNNDALTIAYAKIANEVTQLRSVVSRIQVAMSQGQEL